MSNLERIENYSYLLERCEKALREKNVVTLETLNALGIQLDQGGEYEEVMGVWGRTKVLGEDHKDTMGTLMSLGIVYKELKNFEKGLEYYERALKGYEGTMGKNHPNTLVTVINIAIFIKVD